MTDGSTPPDRRKALAPEGVNRSAPSPARERPTDDNPGGPAEAKRAPTRAVRPRHAASLLLWRRSSKGLELLMGLRHANHRFLPNVLVFPGGRVDVGDHRCKAVSELREGTIAHLKRNAPGSLARALGIAAARELHEETGLVMGRMEGQRLHPDLGVLDYLCRAVTPPNRFMRFNARFLIAPAEAAHGAIRGSGELEELRFFTVEEARRHKMISITAKVMDEFEAWLTMNEEERAARPLVCFRSGRKNMDARTFEV